MSVNVVYTVLHAKFKLLKVVMKISGFFTPLRMRAPSSITNTPVSLNRDGAVVCPRADWEAGWFYCETLVPILEKVYRLKGNLEKRQKTLVVNTWNNQPQLRSSPLDQIYCHFHSQSCH